ncbi:MAG: SRPBCC domain-containing protein [Bacteroidia bacterium]|nr:SRPBCC domain-containing protein [Bacteroidia bacterium]
MKDYKKYYMLNAKPEMVYKALTDPNVIELWTGDTAEMTTEPGSEFSLWGGDICGKNIDFIENKKIVQQWYFEGEPEESIVTIKLHEDKHGTSVELRHINIPDAEYESISEGWDEFYFGNLIEFYEN